jgi:16S rRNA (guanine(527)-N(7))-methyltransferase RsmG
VEIPAVSRQTFEKRLAAALPALELPAPLVEACWTHFDELRRWAPVVDLIGPGTASEVVERHFAESLAALPWLPDAPARLLDLGSGAGFPGLVLAAARPDLDVHLLEPRERRRAFLAAVARRASLRVRISSARVEKSALEELPDDVAVVTVRALRLDPAAWSALAGRLRPDARLLIWSGAAPPELPRAFLPTRQSPLGGSRERILREYRLRESG